MTASVLRWTVPVGQVVRIGGGPVVHVASRHGGEVEVWTTESISGSDPRLTDPETWRTVEVYGTGHLLPDDHGPHIGSAIDRSFVWHVFEVGEDTQ